MIADIEQLVARIESSISKACGTCGGSATAPLLRCARCRSYVSFWHGGFRLRRWVDWMPGPAGSWRAPVRCKPRAGISGSARGSPASGRDARSRSWSRSRGSAGVMRYSRVSWLPRPRLPERAGTDRASARSRAYRRTPQSECDAWHRAWAADHGGCSHITLRSRHPSARIPGARYPAGDPRGASATSSQPRGVQGRRAAAELVPAARGARVPALAR